MPVSVVDREGHEVRFTADDSDYAIDEVGILHISGTVQAAFQPPAWSYVIKKPVEVLPKLRDVGGQIAKAATGAVMYNVQAGDTEKAFKEAQRRADRGKQQ